jgi:predicted ATP-dependent endonuclease of OLD family
MLAKVANQLGIAWYCVVDDDSGRKKYEKKIKDQLNGVPEADRLVFPYKNVERFLCDTGFGSVYETRMSDQKPKPTSAKGTAAYWGEVIKALPKSYSKPAAALDAVLVMKADQTRIPKALGDVLKKTVALAGG